MLLFTVSLASPVFFPPTLLDGQVEDEEAEEKQPKVGEQEELCEQKVEDSNKQESTDRAPKRPSACK